MINNTVPHDVEPTDLRNAIVTPRKPTLIMPTCIAEADKTQPATPIAKKRSGRWARVLGVLVPLIG